MTTQRTYLPAIRDREFDTYFYLGGNTMHFALDVRRYLGSEEGRRAIAAIAAEEFRGDTTKYDVGAILLIRGEPIDDHWIHESGLAAYQNSDAPTVVAEG